jgi:hypothetical protein
VLKEKVLAQVRGLRLMICLDIFFKMIFGEEWESFERRGRLGLTLLAWAILLPWFQSTCKHNGLPPSFLDGEQAIVNKARKEKEMLDNEPFTEVWNHKLKVHFVPEYDKRQVNVLLSSRNPIPPKRRAFRLRHIAPQPQTLPPPRHQEHQWSVLCVV